MQIAARIFKKFIAVLFTIITAWLFILSLTQHMAIGIYTYGQTKTIESHSILPYAGIALLFTMLLLCLAYAFQKLAVTYGENKVKKIILTLGFVILLVVSAGWIFFCESYPRYDQKDIHMEALRWAGYSDTPFDTEYFTVIARQHGVLYLMAAGMKLLGGIAGTLYPWRIINIAGLLLIYAGIYKLSLLLTGRKAIAALGIFAASCMYIPLIVYTSFHYGSLLAVTGIVWGFYWTVVFVRTLKIRHALAAGISLTFAVLMHQSAAVALIAALIYMIMSESENAVKTISGLAAVLILFTVSLYVANHSYNWITGAEERDALPALGTVLMGITSENPDAGPGAIDGTQMEIFEENGFDGTATNIDAGKRIIRILGEYASGKRSPDFFVRKVKFQWLDPTMGAHKNIYMSEETDWHPASSARYARFYESSFRYLIFQLFIGFMVMVYLLSMLTGVISLIKQDTSEIHFLLQLFFVGGFTFQLLWESLSRYCLSYYCFLIIEAAWCIMYLWNRITAVLSRKTFQNIEDQQS